jgi:hypothetical protein
VVKLDVPQQTLPPPHPRNHPDVNHVVSKGDYIKVEHARLELEELKDAAQHKRDVRKAELAERASENNHKRSLEFATLSTNVALKTIRLLTDSFEGKDSIKTNKRKSSEENIDDIVEDISVVEPIISKKQKKTSSQRSIPRAMEILREDFLVTTCCLDKESLALPKIVLSEALRMICVSSDSDLNDILGGTRSLIDKLNVVIDAIYHGDNLPPLPTGMLQLRSFLLDYCEYSIEKLYSPGQLIEATVEVLGLDSDNEMMGNLRNGSVRYRINILVQEAGLQ